MKIKVDKLGLLVDAQNDFITGTLKNDFAKAKVPNIVNKIRHWDGAIIATHDTHFNKLQCQSNWPPVDGGMPYEETLEGSKDGHGIPVHCIKLTEGYEIQKDILAELQKKNEDGKHLFFSVDKYTFGKIDLPEYIKSLNIEFNEIEIWGFVSTICVLANAVILRAAFPNMKITVDASCIADMDEEGQKAAILCLKRQQIDVINE
jgi:nicotinamidase-related amidase